MNAIGSKLLAATLIAALFGTLPAARADFEVTGPDGRRILLKDDGTWAYVETPGKEGAEEPSKEPPKVVGDAILSLERKADIPGGCAFALRMENTFPFEIHSLVPTFSATRADGTVYDSQHAGFRALRPGDSQRREIRFRGIACPEIARLQVSGGDRCVMGDLDKFAPPDGTCLARIKVTESDLVRFDK